MQPLVGAELGVEGDSEELPWRAATGWPSTLAEDLHAGPVLGDPRRADEDRPQRAARETGDVDVRLEARDLAPEGVALGASCPSGRGARGRA